MSKDWNVKTPDLATLSIHDLWCLSELFGTLREATMNFGNQPRLSDTAAGMFVDDLWGDHFANICETLHKQVSQRVPANHIEAEQRAWTIIAYFKNTDDFRSIMDAAVDAMEAKHLHAA